jgi:hypothetical protein
MLVASAALVTVLAIAGCGDAGSGGGAHGAGEAPTKAGWIQEADRICRDANRKLGRESRRYFAGQRGRPSEDKVIGWTNDLAVRRSATSSTRSTSCPRPRATRTKSTPSSRPPERAPINSRTIRGGSCENEPPEGYVRAFKLAAAYGLKACGK